MINKERTTMFLFAMPKELKAKLTEIAESKCLTLAALLRIILYDFIEKQEAKKK